MVLESSRQANTMPKWCSSFLMLAAIGQYPATAQSPCGVDAGIRLRDGGAEQPVRRVGEAIVFKSGLRVNTDGAANSYHPDGKSAGALNTICNGIAVYPRKGPLAGKRVTAIAPTTLSGPARCQMILDIFRASKARGFAIPQSGTIDWFAIASRPSTATHYRPCIQTAGRFSGFFVAQTSSPSDPTKDTCDPAHWISSTEIPYITLPGRRLAAVGVRTGDVALVHRKVGGRDIVGVAVAADTGNADELGEGSIALHDVLGNDTSLQRLPGNIRNGVTTMIFPGIKAPRPLSRAALEQLRVGLIERLGGNDALGRCLTP